MTEIIIDASNVSPEVLIWIKRANGGHFYIERLPNVPHVHADRFPISNEFAAKLQKMDTESVWFAVEKYLGVGL